MKDRRQWLNTVKAAIKNYGFSTDELGISQKTNSPWAITKTNLPMFTPVSRIKSYMIDGTEFVGWNPSWHSTWHKCKVHYVGSEILFEIFDGSETYTHPIGSDGAPTYFAVIEVPEISDEELNYINLSNIGFEQINDYYILRVFDESVEDPKVMEVATVKLRKQHGLYKIHLQDFLKEERLLYFGAINKISDLVYMLEQNDLI
jgi:hypothetical protein